MKAPNSHDGSVVVGVGKLAEMYDKSRPWARKLLLQWWHEQQRGGPARVFRLGKKNALHTTLAVLHQAMPPARDMQLVRKMEALEREVTRMARRCDELTTRVFELERQLGVKRSSRTV